MDWRLVYSWVVKYSTSFKQQKALSSNNYYTGNAVSGQCKYEGNLMKSSYSIGKSSFLQPPFIFTMLYRLITAYCFKFDCNITNLPLALIIAVVIAKNNRNVFTHMLYFQTVNFTLSMHTSSLGSFSTFWSASKFCAMPLLWLMHVSWHGSSLASDQEVCTSCFRRTCVNFHAEIG